MAAPASTAKAFALAFTGAVAAFAAPHASAQQMAASGTRPMTVEDCTPIKDVAKRAACQLIVQDSINIRATLDARKELGGLKDAGKCIELLTQAKAANRADFEAAKAAAGVTRIEAGNECLVASKLPQRRADNDTTAVTKVAVPAVR